MNLRTAAELVNAPLDNEPDESTRIREDLDEKHRDLVARQKELLALPVPGAVSSDEIENQLTDRAKAIVKCERAIDQARMAARAPYEAQSAAAHAWGRKMQDALKGRVEALRRIVDAYKDKKEREERARRDAAERAAREVAEKARAEAAAAERAARDAKTLEEAIAAEERAKAAIITANTAARTAAASSADLTRARGDLGGLSTRRMFWTFRDLDRGALDLEPLRAHLPLEGLEQAMRSWIKANADTATISDDKQPIRGVVIYKKSDTVFR